MNQFYNLWDKLIKWSDVYVIGISNMVFHTEIQASGAQRIPSRTNSMKMSSKYILVKFLKSRIKR